MTAFTSTPVAPGAAGGEAAALPEPGVFLQRLTVRQECRLQKSVIRPRMSAFRDASASQFPDSAARRKTDTRLGRATDRLARRARRLRGAPPGLLDDIGRGA